MTELETLQSGEHLLYETEMIVPASRANRPAVAIRLNTDYI